MRWAVPVIVVALSACILAGSLGFQDTIKETTEYDTVLSDLAPIADAGPVTESVNYNPLTNVTGWVGDVGFDTQSQASLYKYQTDLTWEARTSAQITSSGVWLLTPVLQGDGFLHWYWNDGTTAVADNPPGTVIGGWSGTMSQQLPPDIAGVVTQTITSNVKATIGSTDYAYMRPVNSFGIPNNTIIKTTDALNGGVLAVRTGAAGVWSYSFDAGSGYIRESGSMNLGQYDVLGFDVYYRDGLFYRISSYEYNGAPNIDEGGTYTIALLSNAQSAAFKYTVLTNSTIYYIKPYTPAYVHSNSSATWRNGYDNTTVKILADAEGLVFTINDYLMPDENLEDTQDPAYLAWMEKTRPKDTGMILITLDSNGGSYWQGVTSYASTKDYTVAEYKYPLLSPYDNINEPIQSITFYYGGAGTHRVAIVDTWIPQDSNGLLWGNAAFNIDTLFPTIWDSENIRIKFNSFVTTGSGLTINGTTYAVSDGNITIDDDTFKLAGSSIEWTPAGTTALVAPNGDRYDLGERTGGFTLNGTWYGVLSMDTFETVQAPAKEAVFGVIPDISWLAWVFVGVLAIGTVGVLATGRQLDMMDMLALGIMGLAGVVVAVI